jgi:predicted nuclease of predicted toxin-antitoxin system
VKLLFDENLSFKLAEKLADVYPESDHVRSAGLSGARDLEIWEFASAEGFTIVSKDDDFRQLSILRGAPPKVIWLQVGNRSTSEIEEILRRRYPAIEAFDRDAEASFLIVPKDAV